MREVNHDDAIKFFNEHGYLIINSMRQTGKTTLLKKIIESNQDKKIGIRCINHVQYTRQFNIYPNCEYLPDDPYYLKGRRFDIIIGDEVYIQPNLEVKTVCVRTNNFVEFSLKPSEQLLKQIKEIKPCISEHQFEIEFGQYM